MTPAGERRRGRPEGRATGDTASRDAILAAARRRFAEQGFSGATIRAIAADAGTDPALVLHYYGSKADLFAASVRFPVSPDELLAKLATGDPEHLGEAILRTVLGVWRHPEALSAWLALLRSATTDEQAARMFREFISDVLFTHVGALLEGPDVEYRLTLVASHIVGVGIVRHVLRIEPLASASDDALVAAVAPTLQRYLTGELEPPPPVEST